MLSQVKENHEVAIPAPDFRLLFESAPAMMLVLDPSFHIVAATDCYLAATQTKRGDIVGRLVFDVFPDNPDEIAATGVSHLRRSLQYVLAEKKADTMALLKYDIRVQGLEGLKFEARYWSPVNTPLLDAEGRVQLIINRVEEVTAYVRQRQLQQEQGALVATLETETGKMQAELIERASELQSSNAELREHLRHVELRATQEALLQTRKELNQFFTLSVDMMCVSDAKGFFRRINPAFQKLGYSEAELMSKPLIEFLHPDDRHSTAVAIETLASGTPLWRTENRYLCSDGTYRAFSWNSTPDSDGLMYSIGRDVTEEKKSIVELQRARALAESAHRELESFSYTVAHDLRAPLRSIDGFSQALLEDYQDKLDDEGRGYLQRLRAGAQRMAQLIDDLLALSRLSRGELSNELVDLSALARGVLERLRETHPDRQVEVHIEAGLSASGDTRLLLNVLENLLGNAWKFSARKDHARIEVGSRELNGERVFFVRDNGAGFDMAYQHKLFGVFQRLHGVKEFEGTGIGLASVQRIINRHGGRIWPEAAVDQGATFFFTLPIGGHV